MYHFEKKTLKNFEIFERKKKNGSFLKNITRKSNALSSKIFFFFFNWLNCSMPLVQRLFFLFENFSLFFWERFGNLEFFFFFFNIYMNKVHQMLHGFLEFKETKKYGINKQTLSLTMMLQANMEWGKVGPFASSWSI